MRVKVEAVEEFPVFHLHPAPYGDGTADVVTTDLYQRYEDAAQEWYAVQREIRAAVAGSVG